MVNGIGFDNDTYIDEQAGFILERANRWDKLYLEFGGKLLWDYHAARVLPEPLRKCAFFPVLKTESR